MTSRYELEDLVVGFEWINLKPGVMSATATTLNVFSTSVGMEEPV